MQTDNKKDFSLQSSLNSPVVNINFEHRLISSKSSLSLRTTLSCTRNNKVYKTEWNSDIHPNGLEMKAQIHTPHVSYEKNAVGFSVQRSDNTISSDISFEYSDNKKVSIQTVIQAQEHGLALTWKSRTPYEPVNDVQINAVIKNKRNEKSLKVDMKVDERSVCKVEGIMRISSGVTDIKGSFKVFNIPKVQLQDLNVQFKSSPNSALLSGNIELKNNKKFSLSSEIRKDDHDISTTSSIVTPYKGWKDAELHLSIKPESSKMSALCYVSVNGEKKGELSIASSPQIFDIKGRLNTFYTPEVSAHVKSENARDSFSISANVMKSTSPLLSLSLNRQSHANGEKLLMQAQKSGKTLLDVEVSQDDHRDNSKQLSFKASGEFPAVSITFSKRNSDPNSLSTELRVCRDVQSKAVCHSLVSNYKSLANSEGHRLLKKFTMDFEKSEGRSSSLTLGRFQVLVSATGNDYILKAIAEADDMKVGTEQKLHIRLHKNDRCSIDSMFYWPKYISKFRGSVLHNAQQFNLEVDALPNKDDLSSKLSLQIKRDIDARNHEHSGLLKLTHSRWSQPILLTYKLQPVERYYVKGKVVIHSGPVGGKSIILEVKPDIQKEAKFMLYKVSIDEKIVAYWNVFRKSSRRDDTIGYEWKYVSPDGEKRGGLTLVFFDKHGGRPKSLKVKWISPSADYEVIGSVAQAPNDVSLSIASNGQKLKEFRVSTSDSCVDFVGPTTKGQICINKREGSEWRLLDAYLQCRGHHCLDFKVVVDPENPDYILVVYKPSKDESCRALWEKVSLKSLLRGHSVKELKQEGLEKLEKFQQDVLEPLLSKWRKVLWDLKEDVYSRVKDQLQQHDQMVKEYIRKLKEIKETLLTRIQSVIPESVKEAYRKLSQALLEKMYYYYQKLQETAVRYWPPICENAWFCSDIKSALQKFDAQETKVWVSGKLAELKNYVLQFKLPTLRLIHTSDIVNLFKDCFNRVKQTMDRIFGAFIARIIESRAMLKVKIYLQKIETYFRQKAIDVIDAFIRRVRHIFSEDQDLQNAQHLILKAKAEVIKAWQNKEEIAQNSMRQIENSVKHKFDEFVKPKFQVLKSEPNDGEYVLKIRQPLTKSDAEDIKHELIQLISKLQDYIRSFLRW